MKTALHQQQPIAAYVSPTNASRECMVRAETVNIASRRPPTAGVSDVCTRERST